MQYIITFPETKAALALINYIKSSGSGLKIKAIKSKNGLGFVESKKFDIPDSTDKELQKAISYSSMQVIAKELGDED